MSDLKPCPFCGGEAAPASHIEYSRYATRCKSCGVHGPAVILPRDAGPQETRRLLNGADRLWNTRAELAASRHELDGAKKSARAQARIIESLQQQRAHLNAQRDQWIEARNTLDSELAANARLTEELAASREREARMRGIGGQLSNVAFNLAQRAGHVISSDDCSLLDGLRKQWDATLAEGAQG